MVRFTDKGAFRAASALLLAGWAVGVQEPAAWAQEPGQNPEERTESELPASPDGRAAGITPGAIRLEDVVVTATRSARPVSSIPGSVQVVTRKEIEDQLSLSSNPADLLAKYVPGYSANNENISGASENFRGRNVQVLVDGVPRNTPLRDVSRIISLIDLHQVERIEIIGGATSIYGNGATGGIVNFITKAGGTDPISLTLAADVTAFTADLEDSLAPEIYGALRGDTGLIDYYVGARGRWTEDTYDGDGDLLPADPFLGQGGLSDATFGNLLANVGADFGDQRLSFGAEIVRLDQNPDFFTDYESDPVSPDFDAPYEGKSVRENSVYLRADYTHRAFLLGVLDAEMFYNDIEKRFAFAPVSIANPLVLFSGNPLAPVAEDGQTELDAKQWGTRVTVSTPLDRLLDGLSLTWGADYLHDETEQDFVNGVTAIAPMEQDSYAVFAQMELSPFDWLLLRGGVRHERFDLALDAFARPAYFYGLFNAVLPERPVSDGDFDYKETVFNLGAVVFLTDEIEVFGGFSQGFALPDVGAFTRRAGIEDPFGTGVLGISGVVPEAQVVNNYELGVRGGLGRLDGAVSGFISTSDEGTNFNPLTERIVQQEEIVYGVEATAQAQVSDPLTLGTVLAYIEGKRDTDGDGDIDDYLPNNRIGSPFRATLYADYTTPFGLDLLAESVYWSGRERFDGDVEVELKDALLFNLAGEYPIAGATLRFGIDNLFDADYENPTASSVRNRPVNGFGRVIRIGFTRSF